MARAAQAPSVGVTPSAREAGAGVEPTRGAWKAQAITVKRTREAGRLAVLACAFQAPLVGSAATSTPLWQVYCTVVAKLLPVRHI